MGASAHFIVVGSAAQNICHVAQGVLDVYFEDGYGGPWDVVAGIVSSTYPIVSCVLSLRAFADLLACVNRSSCRRREVS